MSIFPKGLVNDRKPTEDPKEIERRILAHRKSGNINFGPTDGICWSCNKQIFSLYTEDAEITGCPFCHRSFCD